MSPYLALPSLIGLTGPSGSGKDLTAALLSMLGYKRLALADFVRAEIFNTASVEMTKHEASLQPSLTVTNTWKRLCRINDAERRKLLYHKPTPAGIRALLQWWGTDYRRQQDPDYWIKLAEQSLINHLYPQVITDIRFENEASWLISHGAPLWLISRPAVAKLTTRNLPKFRQHISETTFGKLPATHTIDNSSDLQHLAGQVRYNLGLE